MGPTFPACRVGCAEASSAHQCGACAHGRAETGICCLLHLTLETTKSQVFQPAPGLKDVWAANGHLESLAGAALG